tara:strand:- start:320 stop:541 length:222 start_codon:yes stop_codon:yes gene_type:complete
VAIRQQQVRYQLTDPTPAFQDGQLMANEKANRKPVVEEDLPNPGERQRCRLPDWWETLIRLNWRGLMPGPNNS